MRGKETPKGAPSADLLVCFPSRAHLTLMQKSICSPARPPSETSKSHRRRHQSQQLKRPSTRLGQASPLLWAKNKQMGPEIEEPTSPKVTCAGQIKVRPKAAAATACKSWQSVMEEIERIHNSRNKVHKKRPGWMESLGLKKEIMQFLTCLRSMRFDLRCFGTFPESEATSDDEVGVDNYEYCHNNHSGAEGIDGKETSRTIFSKWFMVLQENQSSVFKEERREKERSLVEDAPPIAPPPNALLLMRCRSAPAKSRLQGKGEEDHDEGEEKEGKEGEKGRGERLKKLRMLMEEEKREQEEQREKAEKLAVMRYGADVHEASSDIARERWASGGGARDMLSRSMSWKR
ncbi:hypothetical protein ACJRO7_022666 [Eucalyptus globulus]|uniref:Uncharacterized protein n=1 Tax=Eucalyptus globulus TaxID=34317 RepID=A0ABD3K552_EUCGL